MSLFDIFRPKVELVKDKNGKVIIIQSGELINILRTKQAVEPNLIYKIGDNDCRLCTKKSMEKFVKWSHVSNLTYKSEVFDCNKYATCLYAEIIRYFYPDLACGEVWGESSWKYSNDSGQTWRRYYHGWNWFIDENRKLWWIEPQTDRIYEPDFERKVDFIKT